MNILDEAKKAFELFQQGRSALEALASGVADGTHALSTTDKAELDRMLATERAESQAAHDNLQNAINASRG
jgi:hypothetical protein